MDLDTSVLADTAWSGVTTYVSVSSLLLEDRLYRGITKHHTSCEEAVYNRDTDLDCALDEYDVQSTKGISILGTYEFSST